MNRNSCRIYRKSIFDLSGPFGCASEEEERRRRKKKNGETLPGAGPIEDESWHKRTTRGEDKMVEDN